MTDLDTAPRPQDGPIPAPRDVLFARLDELTAEEGHFEPVGRHHWALFEDQGTTLVVSFARLEDMIAAGEDLTPAHAVARTKGWSHLCLISDGDTWFRDEAVYRHFDRLVDDAFFEDFDRVLFYGHGSGGHAACAFSVASPGSHVLALSACASLAGPETRWDRRFLAARRLDFTSRYGYAPDMLEGAEKVVVIHDLTLREEAMHSALFRAPWVTRLSTPLLGREIQTRLQAMNILPQVIDLAMAGNLTTENFARLWRKRRNYGPYLRALVDRAEAMRRRDLAIRACRSIVKRLRVPHFARRLEKLGGKIKG